MGHAKVISTIKRNGGDRTVVRVIKGKLTCSKVKQQEDIRKMGEVIGVYNEFVPASWVAEDLNSAGFVD